MHWNVSIGPEKWHIFGRFPTFFPLKRPTRREKISPTWRRPSVTSWMTTRLLGEESDGIGCYFHCQILVAIMCKFDFQDGGTLMSMQLLYIDSNFEGIERRVSLS
jgi:hypothetical protein